jgi:hypothetical protein
VHATPIDSRDTRWERDESAYRVYFWDPDRGWASDEYRLTHADVVEVLAWARENAQGRRVTLWVEAMHDGELGLIRLEGWEPVRFAAPPAWVRS